MRLPTFHRPPKAHNDNEDSSLRFRRATARELFIEKIRAWQAFWTNLGTPKKKAEREDYNDIFDIPESARIFTLSPSRKNRWK